MKEGGAKSLLVIGEEAMSVRQNAEILEVFWLVGWLVFYCEGDQILEKAAWKDYGLSILESPRKPALTGPAFRS